MLSIEVRYFSRCYNCTIQQLRNGPIKIGNQPITPKIHCFLLTLISVKWPFEQRQLTLHLYPVLFPLFFCFFSSLPRIHSRRLQVKIHWTKNKRSILRPLKMDLLRLLGNQQETNKRNKVVFTVSSSFYSQIPILFIRWVWFFCCDSRLTEQGNWIYSVFVIEIFSSFQKI